MACDQRIDPADIVRHVQAQWIELSDLDNDAAKIPPSMQLQPSMIQAIQNQALSDALFSLIRFGTGVATASSERGRTMIQRHLGSVGALVWVVRRPGCSFCRHQAGILAAFANLCPLFLCNNKEDHPKFQLFGIVKDTCDEESLVEYQRKYFSFPLYVDSSLSFYQALGDRKLSLSRILTTKEAWQSILCQLYQSMFASSSAPATEQKGGDGFLQGGLVLLDRRGKPVAMYPEQPGPTLPLSDIYQAMQAVIQLQENASSKNRANVSIL